MRSTRALPLLLMFLGCGHSEHAERLAATQDALSVKASRTFGFESTSDWSKIWSSPQLALNPNRTEGAWSLSVRGGGFMSIVSRKLTRLDLPEAAPSVVGFDIRIPERPANPWWFGSLELYVDAPSAGIWGSFLGHYELQAFPRGQFKRAEFAVPGWIRSKLNGQFDDLTFRVTVNTSWNETSPVLLDRFTYGPGSVTCTAQSDGSPCTIDGCTNGVPTWTPLPVGTGCDTNASVCDGAGSCDASGVCVIGPAPVIDDGNACTADVCDPTSGVIHTPMADGSPCNDGDDCNGAEQCSSAACVADSSGPITMCPDGSVRSQLATLHAPAGALEEPLQFHVERGTMPPGLPDGFDAIGEAVQISPVGRSSLPLPITVDLHYADSAGNELDVGVMHYSAEEGWDFIGKTQLDTTANLVTFRTRQFSLFVPVVPTGLTPVNGWTAFDPDVNGWPMANFGAEAPFFDYGQASPAHCFGMTAHALWFWRNIAGRFKDAYSTTPVGNTFSVAEIAALLAQYADQGLFSQELGASTLQDVLTHNPQPVVARSLWGQIGISHSPVLLALLQDSGGTAPTGGHSVIAYGYSGNTFQVWDPDPPHSGTLAYVPEQGSFAPYRGFNVVLALPAAAYWSANGDHHPIWSAASASEPFATSSTMDMTYPAADEVVSEAAPTLSIDLSLGSDPTTAGFIFDGARNAIQAFPPGSNQQVPWSWTPPGEGQHQLLLVAVDREVPAKATALVRKFVVCSDPLNPEWDGTRCTGCQDGANQSVDVSTFTPDYQISMALDSTGNASIGWFENDLQRVVIKGLGQGQSWNGELGRFPFNTVRRAPTFAYSPQDVLSVVMPVVSETVIRVYYNGQVAPGDVRFLELVDRATQGDTWLAFDPQGRPWISYLSAEPELPSGQRPRFAHWSGSAWQITTLDAAPYVSNTSLAVNPNNGEVYAAYTHTQNNYEDLFFSLVTLSSSGAILSTRLLESTGDQGLPGYINHIVVDHDGEMHAAYLHGTGDEMLVRYVSDVALETIATIDQASPDSNVNVAVDSKNVPYVAYNYADLSNGHRLMRVVKRRGPNDWVDVTPFAASQGVGDLTFAIDNDDGMQLGFVDSRVRHVSRRGCAGW